LDDTRIRTHAPDCSASAKVGCHGQEYSFTGVLRAGCSQQAVYDATVGNLLDKVCAQQKDALVFAYGVTNSGKTYTVEGTKAEPGLIPRALRALFERKPNASVHVSFVQIYNDQVHDLQEPPPSQPGPADPSPMRRNLKVKLREEGVVIEGLKETEIKSAEEGMRVLERGRENRATHDNSLNATSSRSHTVWMMRVDAARLHIVDLAGSERGKRTKATGQRQQEASNINLSLSQLMQCLEAIRFNQRLGRLFPDKPRNKAPFKPIPFRGSKLTLLFRDCLRGRNCGGVAMIVNASVEASDYDETLNALRYGELVKSTAVETLPAAAPPLGAIPGMKYDYNGRLTRVDGAATAAANAVAPAVKPPTISTAAAIGVLQTYGSSSSLPTTTTTTATAAAETIAALQGEIAELKRELAEARTRAVMLEVEIREEVAKEMGERIAELERRYGERLARACDLGDDRFEALAQSVKKRAAGEHGGGQKYTLDDLKVLAEQIDECEEEMERMRQAHAREVESLREELNIARRAQIEAKTSKQAPTRVLPATPAAVAEERKRVDRLLQDLELQRAENERVAANCNELQAFAERAVESERAASAREAVLLQNLSSTKAELENAKARLVAEEKTVILLRSRGDAAAAAAPHALKKRASSSPEAAERTKRDRTSPRENNDPNELASSDLAGGNAAALGVASKKPVAATVMQTRARRV